MSTLPHSKQGVWQDMQQRLSDQLTAIAKEELNPIPRASRSIEQCHQAIRALRNDLLGHTFDEKEEATLYHKQVEPFFQSRLFFHSRVYDLELSLLYGGKAEHEKILREEVVRIELFCREHHFLCQYFQSGSSYLDEIIFSSPRDLPVMLSPLQPPSPTLEFAMYGIYVLTMLSAYEMLQVFLDGALEQVGQRMGHLPKNMPPLIWTDSKTALIELIYAVHAGKCFNNGKADIKSIIEIFQLVFHVNLGNYPRTFQEILCRKTGYTNFIDFLKSKLLMRIQTIEEKYDPK